MVPPIAELWRRYLTPKANQNPTCEACKLKPLAAFIAGSVLVEYPQGTPPTATPPHLPNARIVPAIAVLSTPGLDH